MKLDAMQMFFVLAVPEMRECADEFGNTDRFLATDAPFIREVGAMLGFPAAFVEELLLGWPGMGNNRAYAESIRKVGAHVAAQQGLSTSGERVGPKPAVPVWEMEVDL